MENQIVILRFKRTDKVRPVDGQTCLVFNPCDGYRIAEWYEPGDCFLVREETLSSTLATMWMELPELHSKEISEGAKVVSVEVAQAC